MAAIRTAECKIDAQAVADELTTPEIPVTKRAVEQQWVKLKNQAKENNT